MSSNYHIGQKTYMEVICTINILAAEKVFYSCYGWRFVSRFFSDRVKKLVVHFGLYESSLDFRRRENEINAAYEEWYILLYADS